jgi:diguanylate cyclase (GGDEF)-like protein
VVVERVTEVVDRLLRLRLRETVKVLAIDDDPVILDALPTLLAPWGIRVTGLENPLDFRSALVTASPDFLLLDVEMPGLSGIDLCQAVRADPRWQDLPILFLTVSRDPDTISRMFAAGGDDYLTKPIVGPELLTRLTYRWERSHLPLILSTRESITGLLNQPTSERELEGALREAKESGRPLSFVTIAIDDLDRVHWQHGHGTGNRILQFLGNLLKSRFLAGEVVGYWGNGEFAIGLPECSKTEAGDRVEDLLRSFRQHIFSSPDGDRFQVNPRRGIAEYPVDGLNLRSLYRVTVRGRSGGSVYRDEGLS